MHDVTDMRGFVRCLEEMGEIKTLEESISTSKSAR